MIDAPTALGMMSRRKLAGLSAMGALAAGSLGSPFIAAAAPASIPDRPPLNTSGQKLPWPVRGSFSGKAVIGPHQSGAAAMVDDRPYFGVYRERTFFYGNLRDAEGNLYEVVRGIPGQGFGGLHQLIIQTSVGKDTLHMAPELMQNAAISDGVTGRIEGTDAVWASPPTVTGKPFRITMSADGNRSTWTETGLFDLTGELLGPGLQWHIPDAAGSELYVSQIYVMTGHFQGKPVRGVLALDQSYLPQGMLQYSGKDPLFRPDMHHRCWYTWGTQYTDGSYNSGHFVLGTDRIGFALFTDEKGNLTLDTDVSGTVELMPDGIWPKYIRIHTNRGDWEFLPDSKGRMPDLLGGGAQAVTPQNEGRWHKIGDHREPTVWFAWGEVQSGGNVDYSQHTRF